MQNVPVIRFLSVKIQYRVVPVGSVENIAVRSLMVKLDILRLQEGTTRPPENPHAAVSIASKLAARVLKFQNLFNIRPVPRVLVIVPVKKTVSIVSVLVVPSIVHIIQNRHPAFKIVCAISVVKIIHLAVKSVPVPVKTVPEVVRTAREAVTNQFVAAKNTLTPASIVPEAAVIVPAAVLIVHAYAKIVPATVRTIRLSINVRVVLTSSTLILVAIKNMARIIRVVATNRKSTVFVES